MKKNKKIVYIDGYDHYSRKRNIQLHILLNQAEYYALQDLMAVLKENDLSKYIRAQIFKPYQSLTAEKKKQLEEVAKWREKEDSNNKQIQ